MVVTVSLNLLQGGGGFGLALCEQGGAYQDSLSSMGLAWDCCGAMWFSKPPQQHHF